jgi:hypothetical protein
VLRSAGRIRRPYERYFRLLHQASGGLVRDALRLWLSSVKRIDEREAMVHVGPVPRSPFAALLELPDEVFLHLYQVARMGWMDAEVHARLFRVGRSTAEAHLARLHRLGLLEPHGPVFRVATHLRGAVVRAVIEKGWLG